MKKIVAGFLPIIIFVFITGNLFAVSTDIEKGLKKPVIGITASLFRTLISSTVRSYVNEYYVNAVADAGGVPIILPVTENVDAITGMTSVIDGLILSGGADINPLLYGEEAHPSLEKIMPRRDAFEMILLKQALDKKIPVFGICRGEQFINVFHGGTLYQDIHDMTDSRIRHRQLNKKAATQTIDIEKNSWLYGVLGGTAIVNSYHHQAVKDLAPGFNIVARAKDGSVEAIEKKEGSFCIGVQWHPEMMQNENELMHKLFKEFINACIKK